MLFSRRTFLCGATASTLVVPSFMSLLTSKASAASDTIFVILGLSGGNDGYNTIIPINQSNYGRYKALRPNLGLSLTDVENAGTGFDGRVTNGSGAASQYAMHPSLGAIQNPAAPNPLATNNLRHLYGKGKVAFVMGVGIPAIASCRSDHTIASYYQGTGQLTGDHVPGWGSGIVSQLGNPGFSTISLTGGTAPVFSQPGSVVVTIGGDLSSFTYNAWHDSGYNAGLPGSPGFAQSILSDEPTSTMPAEFARTMGTEATGFITQIQAYGKAVPAPDYSTTLYDPIAKKVVSSAFKSQLKQVARLILAGAPGRMYYTGAQGFDTHGNQLNAQSSNLAEVSESITEFLTYLSARNKSSNVVVMTVSDFGRRPYENGNIGTDHGTSSVSILAGDRVNGGVYGSYPSFLKSDLDANGNFVVNVDFRAQIAAVAALFGVNAQELMPDYTASNDDPGLYQASQVALAHLFRTT